MAITTTPLPLLTKLDNIVEKKTEFKVKRIKANNRYVQSTANGLANIVDTFSLTYRQLTDTEVTQVETVFLTQTLDTYITYKPPTDTVTRTFKIPLTWDKNRGVVYKDTVNYRTDISFQLTSLYSYAYTNPG